MTNEVHNVRDGRAARIGVWKTEPLVYDALTEGDVGRTVIYRDYGRAEAGTLVSWRNGTVYARYSKGDTATGADPKDLVFGIEWTGYRP